MSMHARMPTAFYILAQAIAAALLPPTVLSPAAWMEQNLVVPDGPFAGQLWRRQSSPQLGAILETLDPRDPSVRITVRKSAQLGYTTALIGWLLYIACASPARALCVFPTIGNAQDFNRSKLQPAIDSSSLPRRRIFALTKKGVEGSSALYKAFTGGGITLTGASSAADLQSKTVRYAAADEIDQWPRDLDGQGNPMSMVDARQIAFHATGDYKKLQGGTPTDEAGLVENEFQASDRRFWTMPCVHCGTPMRFSFGGYADEPTGTGLRFNRKPPFDAHVVAPCCGARIDHWQKEGMIDAGAFVPECPEPGRLPGFHMDAMSSKFTTWDKVAEAYVACGDDEQKKKTFTNYWLGLPFSETADAPDHDLLHRRAEDYAERVIPADVLLVTAGVDVQKAGLYVEVVGWTPDKRSYVLFFAYLSAGTVERQADTSDPEAPCWRRLTEIFETPLPDMFGNKHRIDALGIDCRYNSPVVYDWVRRHHGAYALRTVDGWGQVPMSTPVKVDYDWRGRRMRHSVQQWQVGSYNLKSRLYAYLRRENTRDDDGTEVTPPGFCHFGSFLPKPYFAMLTAEYIGFDDKGLRRWKTRSPENHALDCRVLNMALAFGAPVFDIEHVDETTWRQRAHERGAQFTAPLLRPVLAQAAPPMRDHPDAPDIAPAADRDDAEPAPRPFGIYRRNDESFWG